MESQPQGARVSSMLAWVAVGVFVLMSALNYLDRQLLAAAAPLLKDEFHLSNADYGRLIGVFALVYAIAAPFGGLLIDRIGYEVSSDTVDPVDGRVKVANVNADG